MVRWILRSLWTLAKNIHIKCEILNIDLFSTENAKMKENCPFALKCNSQRNHSIYCADIAPLINWKDIIHLFFRFILLMLKPKFSWKKPRFLHFFLLLLFLRLISHQNMVRNVRRKLFIYIANLNRICMFTWNLI